MTPNEMALALKREPTPQREARFMRFISGPLLYPSDLTQRILPENLFLGILCLERKRAERSNKKLLLLVIDAEEAVKTRSSAEVLRGIIRSANAARRETDLAGWYKHGSVLAILFTEFGSLNDDITVDALLDRVRRELKAQLSPEAFREVHVSVHIFADGAKGQNSNGSENPAFYPDLLRSDDSKRTAIILKRTMDVVGSAAAIGLLLPVFAAIAIAIKLTSEGPVFFKQGRVGLFGKPFGFLKFRSMYAKNDPKIHQDFMKRMIGGEHNGAAQGNQKPVYKMTDDPRVTRIGRFLRRTSLDELPQFINVLKGDMSLVGPRPPIPYEYHEYDLWHRRRVLEIKPGITGLWQVKGRSRVCFDDMVRLDLQYARSWSLWLDIQILLQTPVAVVMGDGAY